MLNSKRSFNNNVYNATKSRSKSTFRGDLTHAVSMHIRVDTQISPDKIKAFPDLQLPHKHSYNENKIQAFRESLKITQPIDRHKYTQRDHEIKSSKKLTTNIGQTQRKLIQLTNKSYRKSLVKLEKSNNFKQNIVNSNTKDMDKIPINYDDLKTVFHTMKKLNQQNTMLKKQLKLISKVKPSSTVIKALLY